MTTEQYASQLRRYVLGAATDHEAAAIEREYFESIEALERVREVEDDLIDEYVSGQLLATEQEAFERRYLTTPAHNRRVAVARALGAAATARSHGHGSTLRRWREAALAAALVVLVASGTWLLRTRSVDGSADSNTPSTDPIAAPGAPAIDAARTEAPLLPGARRSNRPTPVAATIALSPILVRGSNAVTLTVPAGTDVVRLRLLGHATERKATPTIAVVRTVAGRHIWRGAAVDARPRELAGVEIPAALLRPDDYIVELTGTDAAGRTIELHRYFVSVRAP